MGFEFRYRTANAIAFACTVLAVSSAGAQAIVRGYLYDDATGRPISGSVMLVDPSTDAAVVHATTDSSGQFLLQARASTYQLAAVHPGYKSVLSAPIRFQDGERLTVRIPIAESGDPQNKIGVTEHVRPATKAAETARLDNNGVAGRKAAGVGRQYDHDDFDKTNFQSLGQFLQSVPGLRVADPRSASTMSMTRTGATLAGGVLSSRPVECHVGWFVDGHRMDLPGRTDPMTDGLASLPLDGVEAVEVFRGLSETPAQFADPDLRCGVVAIWTRH
ncbi:MAG TPA: carboxypeptidase regulatory-like domain-containing protein [Gemmatimonadaceae bacterium]|jgi:hypothetical protein|nr:carboxypeptidase regulatory-like domain-containing protein [Gemmatimonadaceae bacterium]